MMKIRLFLLITLAAVVASDDNAELTTTSFPAEEVVSRLSHMMSKVFSKLGNNLIGAPLAHNLQLQFAGFSGVIRQRASSPDNCEAQKEEAKYLESEGYANRSGNYYKFYKTEADWSTANDICTKEGTHLIVIDTAEEAQVVAYMLPKYEATEIYVGLTDAQEEGVFVSVLGDRLSDKGYIKWSSNEPDDFKGLVDEGEDCVTFDDKQLSSDIHCDAKFSFFCESHPLPSC